MNRVSFIVAVVLLKESVTSAVNVQNHVFTHCEVSMGSITTTAPWECFCFPSLTACSSLLCSTLEIYILYIERETICCRSNMSNKRLSAHSKKLQTPYSWESMPLFVTVPSYLSHVSQAFGVFFFTIFSFNPNTPLPSSSSSFLLAIH